MSSSQEETPALAEPQGSKQSSGLESLVEDVEENQQSTETTAKLQDTNNKQQQLRHNIRRSINSLKSHEEIRKHYEAEFQALSITPTRPCSGIITQSPANANDAVCPKSILKTPSTDTTGNGPVVPETSFVYPIL
jgi:putative protein kinase ArgK-like GTPase of G3E family